MLDHDDVRVVSFTGSTEVGRKVAEACAGTFKHSCLEMGGKNIIMVMEDANLDLAVDGALWGGFGTTGQRCTASSRIAVHKDVYREFVEKFVARARAAEGGQRPRPQRADGPSHQREPIEDGRGIRRSRQERRRQAALRRRAPGGRRLRSRLVLQPTIFGDCDPRDANLPRGDFRPRRLHHSLLRPRGGH